MITKKILNRALIVVASFTSLFSWWNVDRAALDGSSDWLVAGIGLSLVLVLLSLIMILADSSAVAELAVFCSVAASIPFAFAISHLVAVLIAALFALTAVRRIRRDLELNVQVDILKTLRMGKGFLLAAFALVLASQYYVVVSENSAEKRIPKFEIGHFGGKTAMRILAAFNPSFASLQDEEITVDEFILQSWNDQEKQLSGKQDGISQEFVEQQLEKNGIPQDQREALRIQAQEELKQVRDGVTQDNKELVIREGRKQLSEMVGYDVLGDEKMSDIFSGIIDNKLGDFFAPDPEVPDRAKAYPFIISILLFLSVLSVASVVWWLLVVLVVGLFRLAVKIGIVKIKKVMVEAEIIE